MRLHRHWDRNRNRNRLLSSELLCRELLCRELRGLLLRNLLLREIRDVAAVPSVCSIRIDLKLIEAVAPKAAVRIAAPPPTTAPAIAAPATPALTHTGAARTRTAATTSVPDHVVPLAKKCNYVLFVHEKGPFANQLPRVAGSRQ